MEMISVFMYEYLISIRAIFNHLTFSFFFLKKNFLLTIIEFAMAGRLDILVANKSGFAAALPIPATQATHCVLDPLSSNVPRQIMF